MDQEMTAELLLDWQESIEQFIIGDIRTCLDHDTLEVGLIILSLVAIDSLSGYYCGSQSNRATFKSFLISECFPSQYGALADDLYALRNGLVHDYTSKKSKFAFFRRKSDGHPHLQEFHHENGTSISLNREILAQDVLLAWKHFSKSVQSNQILQKKIHERIRQAGRGFLIVKTITAYPSPQLLSESSSPPHPAHTQNINRRKIRYSGGTIPYNPDHTDPYETDS